DDQWAEFPRAIRLQVRPRLSVDLPNGDVVNATVGVTTEDRTGGFLLSTTDDDPYRQELRTRNVDLGVRGRRLLAGGGRLELKLSGFYQSTSHRIDDQRFRDRRSSVFAEASWAGRLGPGELVAGLSYQRDKFDQLDLTGFDYAHSVPAVFGQLAYPLSDVARATLSARCERHNVYGSFCTPHASLLLRPSPWVTARLTASAGYAAPSVLSGRAEVIGLQAFVPTAMNAERIQHGGLELSWIRDRLRLRAQATFTRITRAVQVVPVPDDAAGRLRLVNAANPTRVFAGDLEARYQAGLVGLRAWYSYGYGHEDVPGDTGRRVVGWLPRHALGGAISLDDLVPGSFAELRTRYVGLQYVWDDPFRTKTPGYFLTDGTVSARAGRARLYLSGENLFDVRLRDYEVVVLPTPGLGGQRTATQWLPARGRVISFGATVEW
ncbi:MAG: TonB-dependent receptor plug domain-containing protein, partial [Gemmatimonadales bacterium]